MAHMDTEELAALIDAAIGVELRAQRQRLKYSRATLHQMSGVSDKTIQRIEEGERSPDVKQLVKLTAALGMTVADFVALALRDVENLDPEAPAPTSQPG